MLTSRKRPYFRRKAKTMKTIATKKTGDSHIPVAEMTKLIKKVHFKTVETKLKPSANIDSLALQSGAVILVASPMPMQIGGQANERDGNQVKSQLTMCKFTVRNPKADRGVWVRMLVLQARANVIPDNTNILQDENLQPVVLSGLTNDIQLSHNDSDFKKLRDKVYYLAPDEQGATAKWATKYATVKVKRRFTVRYPDTTVQQLVSPVVNDIWYIWLTAVEIGDNPPQDSDCFLSANLFHYYKDK